MIIDIAIIVLLVLGLIIGIGRGALKSFLRFLGIAVALVATVFLSGVLIKALSGWGWATSLMVGEGMSLKRLFINMGASSSEFLKWLYGGLLSRIGSISNVWTVDGTAVAYGTEAFTEAMLPYAMAIHAGVLIACLVLYFLIRIIIIIINFIIKSIAGKREKKAVSRLAGGVLGFFNGALFALILIVIAQAALPLYHNVGVEQFNGSFVMQSVKVDGTHNLNEICEYHTDRFLISDKKDDDGKQILEYLLNAGGVERAD